MGKKSTSDNHEFAKGLNDKNEVYIGMGRVQRHEGVSARVANQSEKERMKRDLCVQG
jgi:hypothetical protein